MIRSAGAALAAIALAACSGHVHRARIAAHDDISAIQALPSHLPSKGAAPMTGITVSGTITNSGRQPLRCSAISFLVVDHGGNAISPTSEYCDMPAVAPNRSGYFSATFDTRPSENLQLRFEHPDGSYETHELTVPPQ